VRCQGASDSCSGIDQSTWQFSHTFEPFTSAGNTPPPAYDFTVSLSPASATVAAGSSTTSSVHTAVAAGGNATLSISTASSAVSGTYSLTVTGKTGSTTHAATYALTVTGGATACSAAQWNKTAVYVGGNTVSYGGHTWKAKWWTTGETPGTTGEWGVWQDLGTC
jgi:hypothetical protein